MVACLNIKSSENFTILQKIMLTHCKHYVAGSVLLKEIGFIPIHTFIML